MILLQLSGRSNDQVLLTCIFHSFSSPRTQDLCMLKLLGFWEQSMLIKLKPLIWCPRKVLTDRLEHNEFLYCLELCILPMQQTCLFSLTILKACVLYCPCQELIYRIILLLLTCTNRIWHLQPHSCVRFTHPKSFKG